MKLYSVINMDVVGSRQVKDRQQLQINLTEYIDRVNARYADILASPAAITLGDEWQLITHKPSESYNVIHEFQQLLWKDGIELYAGIGIGGLSTPVSDDIRRMDGPCFHSARSAINIAKNADKLKNKYNVNKLNRVFFIFNQIAEKNLNFNILDFYYTSKARYRQPVVQEIAAALDNAGAAEENVLLEKLVLERTINLIIENNEVLKAKMTKKQRDIYIAYSELGSYRKVAGIQNGESRETIGGISQKLNSASYFTIQRNHNMVSVLLDTYCSMGV